MYNLAAFSCNKICMFPLLTANQKASLVSDFQSVIDTFLRPFKVYQEATKTVIVTDPNYNPYESFNQNNTDVVNTPNFTIVQGRILYDNDQEWSFKRPYSGRGGGEGQLKIKDETKRAVRIKVDAAGNELLKTSKKIEIDGYLFDVQSMPRPHGLFSTEIFTYYLVRSL